VGHQDLVGAVPREIIARDPQRSFRCVIHDFPSAVCGWAAHPEYEIHLIQRSTGTIIAGDYVGTFGPGHLSMMGPMLPHDWVSDVAPGEVVYDRDALVHFTEEWLRQCMALMPELQRLDGLLKVASRGVQFAGTTANVGADRLLAMVRASGPAQIACMFELLAILSEAPADECEPLASKWMGTGENSNANAAVEAGLSYIFDNLTGDIRLAKAAQLAFMSEPTFSKYFKRAAGMSFSSMVKRLRIAHARRLLDTTDSSIVQVALASGYRNMSNFNRQFLMELGMTPSAYRRLDPTVKPPAAVTRPGTKAAAPA
jgi:AraC-like DNA-binding protein